MISTSFPMSLFWSRWMYKMLTDCLWPGATIGWMSPPQPCCKMHTVRHSDADQIISVSVQINFEFVYETVMSGFLLWLREADNLELPSFVPFKMDLTWFPVRSLSGKNNEIEEKRLEIFGYHNYILFLMMRWIIHERIIPYYITLVLNS